MQCYDKNVNFERTKIFTLHLTNNTLPLVFEFVQEIYDQLFTNHTKNKIR